jgi:hypothetical protein
MSCVFQQFPFDRVRESGEVFGGHYSKWCSIGYLLSQNKNNNFQGAIDMYFLHN